MKSCLQITSVEIRDEFGTISITPQDINHHGSNPEHVSDHVSLNIDFSSLNRVRIVVSVTPVMEVSRFWVTFVPIRFEAR